MDSEQIVYRHAPRDGVYIIGVPQRDLTQADVDSAGPDAIRRGVESGLYVPAKVKPPEDTRTPAEKAADTRRANAEAAAKAEADRLAAEELAKAQAQPQENAGDLDADDSDQSGNASGEGDGE